MKKAVHVHVHGEYPTLRHAQSALRKGGFQQAKSRHTREPSGEYYHPKTGESAVTEKRGNSYHVKSDDAATNDAPGEHHAALLKLGWKGTGAPNKFGVSSYTHPNRPGESVTTHGSPQGEVWGHHQNPSRLIGGKPYGGKTHMGRTSQELQAHMAKHRPTKPPGSSRQYPESASAGSWSRWKQTKAKMGGGPLPTHDAPTTRVGQKLGGGTVTHSTPKTQYFNTRTKSYAPNSALSPQNAATHIANQRGHDPATYSTKEVRPNVHHVMHNGVRTGTHELHTGVEHTVAGAGHRSAYFEHNGSMHRVY